MTPQEIAEARPALADSAAEMPGGLPRKDQRAAGELYVRGLLTDGQRKSMRPMAGWRGIDHQRLQQFITSSTWDYVAVRRNIARWLAAGQPVGALVVDDTGFPKDGTASPCAARQYSGTLGKIANCQVGVSVHLAGEHASCAAGWRLVCPESWDDAALAGPVAAARARYRRPRAGGPALAAARGAARGGVRRARRGHPQSADACPPGARGGRARGRGRPPRGRRPRPGLVPRAEWPPGVGWPRCVLAMRPPRRYP